MINYRMHKNGWTVIIEDFDLKTSTQDDINQIAKLIATSTCVVLKNQSLEIEDELRVINMFGNPDMEFSPDEDPYKELVADSKKDPGGVILRITGELRDGKPGGGGWHSDFEWHCNMPSEPNKKPIVWLYGIRGTVGSRTSWNNNFLAYKDLSDEIKDKISGLHTIYGNISAPEYSGHTGVEYNMDWTPPLVHKNIAGQRGMYFSPLQILKFVELTQEESDELKDMLFKHVIQEKYLYHHDWDDGDVVLSEQWLGIHKRWAFDKMDKRLLHRAAMDFPKQDYTK